MAEKKKDPVVVIEGVELDVNEEVTAARLAEIQNAAPTSIGHYRQRGTIEVTNFTVPGGTQIEGRRTKTRGPCRLAFDQDGGIHPIEEETFREEYVGAWESVPPQGEAPA